MTQQEWYDSEVKPLIEQLVAVCKAGGASVTIAVAGPKAADAAPVWLSAGADKDGMAPASLQYGSRLTHLIAEASVAGTNSYMREVLHPIAVLLMEICQRSGHSMVMAAAESAPANITQRAVLTEVPLMIVDQPDAHGARPLQFINALAVLKGAQEIMSDADMMQTVADAPTRRLN